MGGNTFLVQNISCCAVLAQKQTIPSIHYDPSVCPALNICVLCSLWQPCKVLLHSVDEQIELQIRLSGPRSHSEKQSRIMIHTSWQ